MKILSLSEVKMKLSQLVDEVEKKDEEITITRNGKPAAVLLSPDEFEGFKETALITSDKDFIKEIRNGMKKVGKGKLYSLAELFED